MKVYVCSNTACRTVFSSAPGGHCPCCVDLVTGVGWSAITCEVRDLSEFAPLSPQSQRRREAMNCGSCRHWNQRPGGPPDLGRCESPLPQWVDLIWDLERWSPIINVTNKDAGTSCTAYSQSDAGGD
jgi:hypothetical protein